MPSAAPDPVAPQALLRAFLTNIPDVVYFKDRESRLIAVSDSFSQHIGGAGSADVIGKTDFDLFDEAHARPAFEDERRIIRTGEPVIGKLEKEVWPDGQIAWALTSKMPLRDETGAIIGTFGISKDVTASKQTEEALENARKELMDAARLAGMAEVATGVLHNVGNVLNSLNVSNAVVGSGLRSLKAESFASIVELLEAHQADLGRFLTEDPKGRMVTGFLSSFSRYLCSEKERLLHEVQAQQENIDHLKEIVSMQQAYATMVGVVEPLAPAALMEDALRMNWAALLRHEVTVVKELPPTFPVMAERGKVLQILVNLIRNAKYAMDEGAPAAKTLTVRVENGADDRVRLMVRDNGIGIAPDHLSQLFAHGFTTRRDGHGFGLHSSALAAREMHGTLSAFSEGPGTGATFTLELPAASSSAAPAERPAVSLAASAA